MSMAVNWVELAQRMAQAARAGVAIQRKRLQEILAERQRKQQSQALERSFAQFQFRVGKKTWKREDLYARP
jgi:hypothetical protein